MSIYGLLINESSGSTKNDLKSANSALEILYIHMLKFKYQPNRQGVSWIDTIREQSYQLYDYIKSKTIYNKVSDYNNLINVYKKSLQKASNETGINIKKIISNDEIPEELEFNKIINREYIFSYMMNYAINDTVKNQIIIGMNR